MSVYQKFIESSSPCEDLVSCTSEAASLLKEPPSQTSPFKLSSPLKLNQFNQQQAPFQIQRIMTQLKSFKSNSAVMLQQQTSNIIPMISTSPMASNTNQRTSFMNQQQQQHNQYKRLLEMNPNSTTNFHQRTTSHLNCKPNEPSERNYNSLRERNAFKDFLKSIDDPILLNWLQDIRFEPELEPLSFQAKTCAYDEFSKTALSIRYSQVSIQEIRSESNFNLDFIDYLISLLPLCSNQSLCKFYLDFSELWKRLVKETSAKTVQSQQQTTTLAADHHYNPAGQANAAGSAQHPLTTITYTTPRKTQTFVKTMRPLDKLAIQIRNLCMAYVNQLYLYQETMDSTMIDNPQLESDLRKLKELYGKFVEISIKAECRNIIQALDFDFHSHMSTNLQRIGSNCSLKPVRPFESSHSQLPLKWALIALWQMTKDDKYICRLLTEKWLCLETNSQGQSQRQSAAKRLDYSTKYDSRQQNQFGLGENAENKPEAQYTRSISHSDYYKLYELCQQQQQQQTSGALSSAMKSRHQAVAASKPVSTIELLIDIIIKQPNKHERLDMINYLQAAGSGAQQQLVDFNESLSAAIYTSNQYKIAALRILTHLCSNDQAIKTILRCFSTPPPAPGHPQPENKIIRSIFECHQTSQEHIYQNETMFSRGQCKKLRSRKRTRFQLDKCSEQQPQQFDEYSDYGSRQTANSQYNSSETNSSASFRHPESEPEEAEEDEEGDDLVVREAVRLIVQLTNPFHQSNQGLDYYTLIGRFSIECLVRYLTNIVKNCGKNRELLYYSLMALANISFITTEPMKVCGTNGIMLELFRGSKSKLKDLELRDQAVTILANTADKNLMDIVSNGGLTFLLSCLESCPVKMANYKPEGASVSRSASAQEGAENCAQTVYCNLQQVATRLNQIESKLPRDRKPIDFSHLEFPDILECSCDRALSEQTISGCLRKLSQSELAAMERIHQKTAVALARMAQDASTMKLVLAYGGIGQLIELCKFSFKRNFSDSVLLACVAALRKTAQVIELKVFRDYNALDLIELDLKQTMEIYGNKGKENLLSKFLAHKKHEQCDEYAAEPAYCSSEV